MIILEIDEMIESEVFTLINKLLDEKLNVVKFLRSTSISSFIDPLNLFVESWSVVSPLSWKINLGIGPDILLPLKSRNSNT